MLHQAANRSHLKTRLKSMFASDILVVLLPNFGLCVPVVAIIIHARPELGDFHLWLREGNV